MFVGAVVGVSDFLMITLAKGTVAVGKKIGTVVAESDVSCISNTVFLLSI